MSVEEKKVIELEAELGEARAAAAALEEQLAAAVAALQAAHASLAEVGDPVFASVLENNRNPTAARLRKRLRAAQARNEALRNQLERLRASRTFRWTAPLRRAAERLRRTGRPGRDA